MSDASVCGLEPGKGVQLDVWVGHLGHFLYPHGRGDKKVNKSKTQKNTTLALHWLVHGQFRTKGLKQCVQNWTNWKKETCVDPPIYQGQLNKANQKSNFNAEACNKLSLHSVRSKIF